MLIYRPLVEQKITWICSLLKITPWRNLTFADTNKRQKKKLLSYIFPPPTISAEIAEAEFMKMNTGLNIVLISIYF